MNSEVDQADGYEGRAVLCLPDGDVPVHVTLRGHFQPVDGRYRWYGRIATSAELADALSGRPVDAVLATPHGVARARVTDPDDWQRPRISGVSTPPFPTANTPDEG